MTITNTGKVIVLEENDEFDHLSVAMINKARMILQINSDNEIKIIKYIASQVDIQGCFLDVLLQK